MWIPWSKLRIRITKIGGVEFKDILQEQASEYLEVQSYLADPIEFLEAHIRKVEDMSVFTESSRSQSYENSY